MSTEGTKTPGTHGSAPQSAPREEFYSLGGAVVVVAGIALFCLYLARREILLRAVVQDVHGAAMLSDIFAVLPFVSCAVIAGGIFLLVKATKPRLPPAAVEKEPNKQCPFCAERIKAMATVCRYCGRTLPSVDSVD